jgi:hypothetical protein
MEEKVLWHRHQVDVAADWGADGHLALVEDQGLAVGAVTIGGLAGVLAKLILGH